MMLSKLKMKAIHRFTLPIHTLFVYTDFSQCFPELCFKFYSILGITFMSFTHMLHIYFIVLLIILTYIDFALVSIRNI